VTDADIPIGSTYDVEGMSKSAKETGVSSYIPTDDYLGVTAVPFTRWKITGSKGTVLPNTAINQFVLKNKAGSGPYTYNGKQYATMGDLLESDAVKYEPVYVFNAGLYLDKTKAKDRAYAVALGYNENNLTSKVYPVGQKFIKASEAPNMETATLSAKNAPTREEWTAAKKQAVEQAKESLRKQFGTTQSAEPISKFAEMVKKNATPATKKKPLDD